MSITELKNKFFEIYGKSEGIRVFHSPGRINLIGEHIDYNGGLVFPCALSFGTYALVARRDDNFLNLASTNRDVKVKVDLNSIEYDEAHDWANYPKGIAKELLDRGFKLSGLDILYSGDIPNGAGLSSSASVEVLTAIFFNRMFDLNISMLDLVKLSQKVENEFIGVMCGIMDQFSVGFGKKNKAVLLNCKTLEYSYIPIELGEYSIVIANSNKNRMLQESKYNERRAESESALKDLQTKLDISFLCDLSPAEFEENSGLIKSAVNLNRARHAVYENERVKRAADALDKGDLKQFGELLNSGHESMKTLYEITGFELDALAEAAQAADGCLGSRMMGGGFGGCTLSIVHKDKIDSFIKSVGDEYNKKTNLKADFYIADIGDGAREVY